MRRRRKKFDLYIILFLAVLTTGYFAYNNVSSEDRGITAYRKAIEIYKDCDYEKAYFEFARVPSGSTLKEPALFRQARCATNMDKKELAINKYNKIVHSNSKSSIVPISEYNMASLMFEIDDKDAKKHYKNIIKKHPTSDYAIASEYYLGLIELKNLPENEKKKAKAIENSVNHFKNYIQKSPNGRYSLKSIDEIKKLDTKLNNYDNLLIAKSYYENGEYEKAREYLDKTSISESWTDFAKTESKLQNFDKVRYYTELGLKDHPLSVEQKDIFDVIDSYIATYPTKKEGILALESKNYTSAGADYISYLHCSEIVPSSAKEGCYRTLYEKYPNGQFSADALYNLFLTKYLQKKYLEAQRLGFLHLKKFPNVKSSPAITYFMGKVSNKLKHYDTARTYYKRVLDNYPDTYYAYRANFNLNKEEGITPFTELTALPVVFPYKKSKENNLVVKLALLKDYDLVEELCKKDKFVQSWIAYQKGNYSISALLARNGMDEISEKPNYDDLRWRLIYPLHYYETVFKYKGNNNPIILQSIIKEESHFNPNATSYVGAAGLMQIMPATYNELIKNTSLSNDIYLPENNIRVGSAYYQRLNSAFSEKDLYAISAYNGGIGSVNSWCSKLSYSDVDEFVEQIPYPETKNYVKKVLRSYWVYGNIYQ